MKISSVGYIFAAMVLVASSSLADPSVTLTPTVLRNGKRVLFTITQHDLASMEGCHYNLFAADETSHLDELPGQGLSIATFYRDSEQLEIMATHLKRLSRSKLRSKTATIYIRMLMPCGDESYQSDIVPIVFNTSRRGAVPSTKRLRNRMKYHMRWAEDVPCGNSCRR